MPIVTLVERVILNDDDMEGDGWSLLVFAPSERAVRDRLQGAEVVRARRHARVVELHGVPFCAEEGVNVSKPPSRTKAATVAQAQ